MAARSSIMLRASYEKRMSTLFVQPIRGDKGLSQPLKPRVSVTLNDSVDILQV